MTRLQAGDATLGELGEIVATPAQVRDDDEHPGFHAVLFDPALKDGDWLEAPVLIGSVLISGRIKKILAAELMPFDDVEVQERLVRAVRKPRIAQAQAALMLELAERFPVEPS